MKKYLCLIFFFFATPLFAQNPDGRFASVHITPTWFWGSADFIRHFSVWYPESMSYPSQTIVNKESGALQYPYAYGVSVMLKVPTASYLTMSVSYSFNQRFEEVSDYAHYWSVNGRMHQLSVTASVYNLFSIY
jgi:hypothetical protein